MVMMHHLLIVIVATLAAVMVWIDRQHGTITDLTQQNRALQQCLHTDHIQRSSQPDSRQGFKMVTALQAPKIDWSQVIKELRNNIGGYGYLKTTRQLEEDFHSMSYDELLSALEEITSSDLSKKDRDMLERILCGEFFSRYPERSLTQFISRYRDNIWQFAIAQGFADWIKNNPENAIFWYEEQLASGTFGGRHTFTPLVPPKKLLEYGIYSILASSPDQAGRLLSSVPQNSRLNILSSLRLGDLTPEQQVGWAQLTRTQLSKEDHLKAITWPTQNWSDGDGAPMKITEVEEFLQRIHPDRYELEACILAVAEQPLSWQQNRRQLNLNDIKHLREWVHTHLPELVDSATARAIQTINKPYPDLERITTEYHELSHNDELLIALLEHRQASEHKQIARDVAKRLSDENQRNLYLEKFKATPQP